MTTFGTGTIGAGNLGDPSAVLTAATPTGLAVPVTLDPPSTARPALATLADDFSTGTTPDTTLWTADTAPDVSITGGVLRIQAGAGTITRTVKSAATYNATDSSIIVKVNPSGAGGVITTLRITTTDDDTNTIEMYRQDLTLSLVQNGSVVAGLDYNATSHAWWKIRHQTSTNRWYWSASPDGLTWTDQGSNVLAASWTPFALANASVILRVITTATAGTSTFDNVNTAPYDGAITIGGLAVPVALDNPDATFTWAGSATPDDLAVPVTLDPPSATGDTAATPDDMALPVTLDDVTVDFLDASSLVPDGLALPVTLDNPAAAFDTGATPDDLAVPVTLDSPTATLVDNTVYGGGTYNVGAYNGDPTVVTPQGLVIGVALDPPAVSYADAPPPYTPPNANTGYGAGIYGEGIYFGALQAEITPLFAPVPWSAPKVAQHILGIGPWSPTLVWRGAANYGIERGRRPARPTIALPKAVSKSFTLRLNDGCEARADFEFTRDKALIPEEMHTDLWWQRRDPYTLAVETIGRFNTANSDVASSDDGGVTVTCQFHDYRTLLSERMVMRYLHDLPTYNPPTTSWAKGTTVTEILRFAVPTNMGLDLTAIDVGGVDLGTVREPFEIPLGSTITDVMDNLLAICNKQWEWWVDMPSSINGAPKLEFVSGQRGSDKGVHLADWGQGPTPIASWSMQAASDKYANTIYYIGKNGGVVRDDPAQVTEFGQRDASDSDSSLDGPLAPIILAADKKLAELGDRRPTFTIALRTGFWKGRSHIDVGDTVRVTVKLGAEIITEQYRVTEINVDIDNNGTEAVSLTLGKPLPSGNPRSRRSAMYRLVRKLKNYERQAP